MRGTTHNRTTRVLARALYLTAIVNSLISSAYGQETTLAASPAKPKSWSAEDMLHVGIFDILPSMRAGVTYDDNIYISSLNKQSDVVFSISPYVLLGAGDYIQKEESLLTIEYSPTFFIFSKNQSKNAIDHDAKLDATWRGGNWTAGVNQGVKDFSGTVVEVGNRVDRQIYDTLGFVRYEVSPKTSIELEALQSINNYESPYHSFNEWVVGPWVDYWLTPKVRLGAGVKGGWLDVQQSSNQNYVQGLLRMLYLWSEKLEINVSGGGEYREYHDSSQSRTEPVFSLGANYKPFDNTTLVIEGYRKTRTSVVLANQNYALSGVGGRVSQVVRDNWTLSLGAGYENLDYHSTQANVVSTRRDNYYFTRVGVDWDATDRLSLGVFYLYRQNDSTTATSEFSNNQVGLIATYAF